MRTDDDIEKLQIYAGYFHDAYITGLEYTTPLRIPPEGAISSGWSNEYVATVRICAAAMKDRPTVELRFEDVKRCSFTGSFTEFFAVYLKFVEGLDRYGGRCIVWAGDPSFDPHNITTELMYTSLANFIVAGSLKWRMLENNVGSDEQ